MSPVTARRLLLTAAELAEVCGRTGLSVPPGFGAAQPAAGRLASLGVLINDAVHPAVAAGLGCTCRPHVGVALSGFGGICAAFGIRADLGGSLLRVGGSDVEVSAWPALELPDEIRRVVPELGSSQQPPLLLPLEELTSRDLVAPVVGRLQAAVLCPPYVVGMVVWLATACGWLSLEPAAVVHGRRWATVRPVQPPELAPALAPLVAAALSRAPVDAL